MVQVYGKPGCVQCKYTNRKLEENNISYEYHDITQDEAARQVVEQTGRTQLPLVIAGDRSWHGLRPDHIKALAG